VELHDYIRIVRRRWGINVAMTLAAVAAAESALLQTPQYASAAQLFCQR